MNELGHVRTALLSAAAMADEGFTERQRNRNRSLHFVEALADMFRRQYEKDESMRVLSKHCEKYRLEFGLNELLYDILVCQIAHTNSPRQAKELTFVSHTIWQIESEFAADAREALYDFNKLVLGSAQFKLFIGPRTQDDRMFLDSLLSSAKCCTGTVFAALVPPPARWAQPLDVTFWRADTDGWLPVQA